MDSQYLDIDQVYARLISRLARTHKSVKYLSDDDPYNILIAFIALSSVISSTYVAKTIDNKYIKYPVVDEKSNLNVLENFGVHTKKHIPSSITLTLEYTAGVPEYSISIPAGTRFTVLGVDFVTFEDYYILPNNTFAEVTAYLGVLNEETFSLSQINDQKLILYKNNVAFDMITLDVEGVEFERKDYCRYRRGSGIFGVEYDYGNEYSIVFPINYRDYILSESIIHTKYLSVEQYMIFDPTQETITLSSALEDDMGNSVTSAISVYCVKSFSYGDMRHTADFMYRHLGRLLPTLGKAVTTEDYKNLTDIYPGVAVSAAYDLNSERRMDPFIYIQVPYYTKIVVAPTCNYFPTEYLKNSLYEYYDEIGVDRNQVFLQIIDPRYRLIDLSVLIHSDYLSPEEVMDSYNMVYDSVRAFFKVGNLEFGSTITSDILASVIMKADKKILYSDCLEFTDFTTVVCEADELPLLGKIYISYNYEKIILEETAYLNDAYEFTRPISDLAYIKDRTTVAGPYFRDYAYISDEIFKEQDSDAEITIIRYTNFVLLDYASDELTASKIKDYTDADIRWKDTAYTNYGRGTRILVSDTAFQEDTLAQKINVSEQTWCDSKVYDLTFGLVENTYVSEFFARLLTVQEEPMGTDAKAMRHLTETVFWDEDKNISIPIREKTYARNPRTSIDQNGTEILLLNRADDAPFDDESVPPSYVFASDNAQSYVKQVNIEKDYAVFRLQETMDCQDGR